MAKQFVTDIAESGFIETEDAASTLRRAALKAAELLKGFNQIERRQDGENAKQTYTRVNEDFDPFLGDANLTSDSFGYRAPEQEQTVTLDRFHNIQQ
jgi:hypothetical protein